MLEPQVEEEEEEEEEYKAVLALVETPSLSTQQKN